MKETYARAGGFLSLLGGIASLIGFVALPFMQNPETGSLTNGIQLLQAYAHSSSIAAPGDRFTNALHLSYEVLWAILILFALLTLHALLMTVTRKPGMLLPLLCLLLSLAAGLSLFLMCYAYQVAFGGKLLALMFAHNPPFTPIIGPGWWTCASTLILTVGTSVFALIRHESVSSRKEKRR